MKVLFLCGVFGEESYPEIIEHSRGGVEFSANILEKRIIDGFHRAEYDIDVLSAPYIGAYPCRSDIFYFNGFTVNHCDYKYVNFNNVWGIRNFSRAAAVKRALSDFVSLKDEKLLVIYGAHTPFLDAAAYVKKADSSVKICLIIPDLPQYMNLNTSKTLVYRVAKTFDIRKMYRLMDFVDSFVLLTEQMKDMLPISGRPSLVAESVLDDLGLNTNKSERNDREKRVVYTGKLNEKFGIKKLVESFKYIDDHDFRLILCGSGDCDDYVAKASKDDGRIISFGQVSPDIAKQIQNSADVLINPRPNDDEYTKYSFPSKTVEYLLTGAPVVSYMLDGMSREYLGFIYEIKAEGDAAKAIADAIEKAYGDSNENKLKKANEFRDYAKNKLDSKKIAEAIVSMNR